MFVVSPGVANAVLDLNASIIGNPTDYFAGFRQQGQAAANAAIAVGNTKAQSLLENAQLLTQDVGQLRQTAQNVYKTAVQSGMEATSQDVSQYIGSGIAIEGTARGVINETTNQYQLEAQNQFNKYNYEANRTQMEADIATHQAALEQQAASYEAQSIMATAQFNFNRAKQEWFQQNAQSINASQNILNQQSQSIQNTRFAQNVWGAQINPASANAAYGNIGLAQSILGTQF